MNYTGSADSFRYRGGRDLSRLDELARGDAPDPKAHEVLWTALHGQRWMDTTAAASTGP
jgi:hypothetical protein